MDPADSPHEHPPARRAVNDSVLLPKDGASTIRGLDPVAALAYVRHHHGDEGIARVLRRLGKDDIALFAGRGRGRETKLHTRRWYPFALHCRLLRAIDHEYGSGDLALLFEVGQFMARRDIPRLFQAMAKRGNPGWLVDASTALWRFYHRPGSWELERTPTELIARLIDRPEADQAFCTAFMGWSTAAFELSGAHHVTSSHLACRAQGAPGCIYIVRWEVEARKLDSGLGRVDLESPLDHDGLADLESEEGDAATHPDRARGRRINDP